MTKEETSAVSAVGRLLLEHHLSYQREQMKTVSQKEFARLIGIDDKYYNHIYWGRQKPSMAVVQQFAYYFDDLRFYDVTGYDRPDPRLHYIQRNWDNLSDGVTKKIAEIVSEYLGKKK